VDDLREIFDVGCDPEDDDRQSGESARDRRERNPRGGPRDEQRGDGGKRELGFDRGERAASRRRIPAFAFDRTRGEAQRGERDRDELAEKERNEADRERGCGDDDRWR